MLHTPVRGSDCQGSVIRCARRSVGEIVPGAAVMLPASGSPLGCDQQNSRMPPLLS